VASAESPGFSDPKRIQAYLQALRLGMTRSKAAHAVGLVPDTVREWIKRGEGTDKRPDRPDGRYAKFVAQVEEAEAGCIKEALEKIVNASKDHNHWTAAAWLLERIAPQAYGRKQTTKVEGQVAHVTTYTFAEPPIPEPEAKPPEESDARDEPTAD
jgi:transposase-like protein